ncbi:MAG: hypothetical protein QOC73_549 [Actinomycetota bacterium]|nr:hypothetical protein [Actinomycetota bacterium]
MCVRPVVRKSAASAGGSPDVSPSTRPGSNPRGPLGNGAAAARRPARTCPARRCTAEGPPSGVGDPLTSKTAARSSPLFGRLTRPIARTRCVGCNDSQPLPVARTTSGDLMPVVRPAAATSIARADITTSGRAEPTCADAADRCGSLVTTSTNVTRAWACASSGNGPRCTAATRQPAAKAPALAHNKAAAITRRCNRRTPVAANAAVRIPHTASPMPINSPRSAGIDRARPAANQAAAAGTSSRSWAGSPASKGDALTVGRFTRSRARRAPRISKARFPTPAGVA